MKLKTLNVDKERLYRLAVDVIKDLENANGYRIMEIPPLEKVTYRKRMKAGYACMEYELSYTDPADEENLIPDFTYRVRLFPSGSEIHLALDEAMAGDPPERFLELAIDESNLLNFGIAPT